MLTRRNPFSLFNSFINDEMFLLDFRSFSNFKNFEKDLEFPADTDKSFNKTEELVENETHTIKKEIWTSVDGKQRFERIVKSSKEQEKLVETKENLKLLLDKAVEDQDFEKAIELRDKITKLK